MSEDTEPCTCEPGEYPDLLCPQHGRYAGPVTLLEAARYHPKFGNTPLERAILERERAVKLAYETGIGAPTEKGE